MKPKNQIVFTGIDIKNVNINSVVKFFCFMIVLFGIVLVSEGSYGVYKISGYYKIIEIAKGNGEPTPNPIPDPEPNPEPSIDYVKPTITLSNQGIRLTIIVRDNEELSYITYQWGDEEEVVIEASGDDLKYIETETAIPDGENTIKITAYDISNNSKTEEKTYKTVVKPSIIIEQIGGLLRITATDPRQIEYIEISLNGQTTVVNAENESAEMIHEQQLPIGESNIKVTAHNKDGQIKIYETIYLYDPE